MGAFQPLHLALIALVVLVVFAPKKLPELAKGAAEALRELKKSMHAGREPAPAAPVEPNTNGLPDGKAPLPRLVPDPEWKQDLRGPST